MGEPRQRRPLVAGAAGLGIGLGLGLALAVAPAAALQCRIALALALDVSSSVDAGEYALQSGGLAAALRDPDVAAAFLAVPGMSVDLAIYEWSGRRQQAIAVPWTEIASADDLFDVAAALEARPRAFSRHATAIGEAMLFGAAMLADRGDCPERIIDVSGDGETNDGVSPLTAQAHPALEDVTVNGLVIGITRRILARHYEAFVIHGPGAFVEMADDHADFSRAMRRKLIREVRPKIMSRR
ncbi:MAG: hypothetical protein BWY32_03725 [bacterium ADurb.Bin243]|nr:MAG: hypothetical protein BWY32_03725 [bacterium ADurb.Bin243]